MSEPSRAEVIAAGAARLAKAGVPDAERDARLLYRWAARIEAPRLTATLSDPAASQEVARFEQALARRAARTPVSHIIGERLFWGRSFEVTPDVLDPRPETEVLIAAALDGPTPDSILDLGTGSGCILLTLLCEWPRAFGIATDLSPAALSVAARNAERLGVADRVRLLQSDWTDGVTGSFDLIVSNPPYLAERERAGLAPEVKDHEPWLALGAGEDGLDSYRRIAGRVQHLLAADGRLMVEIGPGQAEPVRNVMKNAGLAPAAEYADMDGRVRVIVAAPGEAPAVDHD